MQTRSLQTDQLQLILSDDGRGYTLDVKSGDEWKRLGSGSFGRLSIAGSGDERQEAEIQLTDVEIGDDALIASGPWTDAQGVDWRLSEEFHLVPGDPRQVRVVAHAAPSASARVHHFTGPTFLAGEGSFGDRKTDGLFPGLEYLGPDEPSSSTAFASANYAGRAMPHPYKIAVPMMAISHDGLAVGLMWDPNQNYGSSWRHPGAVFSSPNVVDGAGNHLMGLFAPGIPRFTKENERDAWRPLGARPSEPLRIEARLVALADASSIDVLKVWVETFGLPEIEAPHSYRENVDLCVRSYLDVVWDETAEGWSHTLADPWGPRFEFRLIAQLRRYSQWPEGDPELRSRAKDQVDRAVARALLEGANSTNAQYSPAVPHLELALHHLHLVESLAGTKRKVDELMAAQDGDGSWKWVPELIQEGSYKTEQIEEIMGGSDSATGLTAERGQQLLAWARIIRDPAAREAGLRAADWCNAQTRPEGAQTWELHLHVPDVLAVPYLIDVNLEAHQLTGDRAYLEQAERWAWTGLPFTYLWAAFYRPIMAYCTVPVFGVTFHDVQSWFGVDVHWNGLCYSDALFRLAREMPDGPWRKIALGIVANGMTQQQRSGPWMGMYPDAFSVVRSEEDYTWWLNPNLIGLNTFELARIPLRITTELISSTKEGDAIGITSGASLTAQRASSGAVHLDLDYSSGESSQTLVAGAGRPASVRDDNGDMAETDSLDNVDAGWRWLPDYNVLIVKALHLNERASIDISF